MIALATAVTLAGAVLLGYTGLRHRSDHTMVRGGGWSQRSDPGSRPGGFGPGGFGPGGFGPGGFGPGGSGRGGSGPGPGLGSARVGELLGRALPWVEIATGGLVIGTFALAPGLAFRAALAVQSGLFLLFAGYLVWLRIVAPGAPCGCLDADSPATVGAVVRNLLFAGSGLFMLGALVGAPAQSSPAWSDRAGLVVFAVVLVMCYLLARSMRRPTGYRPVGGGV